RAMLAQPGMGPTREGREARRAARREVRELRHLEQEDPRPLAERVRSFRGRFAVYLGTSVFLFGINAVTGGHGHHFWWAIFPVMGMGLGVVKQMGNLWAAAVGLGDIFGGSLPAGTAAMGAVAGPSMRA